MLESIFNPDNVVWRTVTKIGYIWWLNVLWLICSLPLITIGASTTALVYSTMKLRKNEGYPTKNFFHSFKENFKQATGLWLIYAVVGGLLGFSLVFWNQMEIPFHQIFWAIALLLVIVYCISLLYVFALQAKFYNTIQNTIKFSFQLAYVNLVETILMGLIFFAVVLINVLGSSLINFLTLNFGVSLVAYILAAHYENIFKIYLEEETEEEQDETDGTEA